MKPLPVVSGRDVVRALGRAGFDVVRIKGSHHRLVHRIDVTRATTVPVHGNRDLPRGTVRDIIDQAGLTVDEFVDLL
jgi:predicted RNA binding protein YcfA (HicA-like mRNA interferase family)